MTKKISSEDLAWAAFYHSGVGGVEKLKKITEIYGGIENAWQAFKQGRLTKRIKLLYSERKINSITTKIKKFSTEKLAFELEKHFIEIITFDSIFYPKKLSTIANPPAVLYCLGKMENLKQLTEKSFGLAVVGSRKNSSYGSMATESLLDILAGKEAHLVSGLAVGIDSLAHQKSLRLGKKNIAVLAGGLDRIYPSINEKLAQKIIEEEGLIISEFPPGTDYFKQNFPARNRIISGLCDALLVIEAGEKSGALITASFATQQGKKIFAVPGTIFSSFSQGSNFLIKKGAYLVSSVEDFHKEIFGNSLRNELSIDSKNKITLNLTEDQKKIIEEIEKNETISLNELAKKIGLPAADICSKITQLEIEGLIERTGADFHLK